MEVALMTEISPGTNVVRHEFCARGHRRIRWCIVSHSMTTTCDNEGRQCPSNHVPLCTPADLFAAVMAMEEV